MDRTSQRAHSCAHKDICLQLPAHPESCPGTSDLCLVLRSESPAAFSSAPAGTLGQRVYTLLPAFFLAYWPLPTPLKGSVASLLSEGQHFPWSPDQPQPSGQH